MEENDDEDQECPFSIIDIVAKDMKTDDEIKQFHEYVQIVYKGANQGLENPSENHCIEAGIEYLPHHHAFIPRQEINTDYPVNCLFHTFYSLVGNDVVIFTKHFSKFKLYCEKHEEHKTFQTHLAAILFWKEKRDKTCVKVDVKMILDVWHNAKTVSSSFLYFMYTRIPQKLDPL